MKNTEETYSFFVGYIEFVFVKRIYDTIISFVYPNYDLVTSELGINLISIRNVIAILAMSWIFTLLIFYPLNILIAATLCFILSSVIFYLLIEARLINFIFDKKYIDQNVVLYLSVNFSKLINVFYLVFLSFIVYKFYIHILS